MLKLTHAIFAFAIVAVATSFTIVERKTWIDWPFTVCATGPWQMISLTLGSRPARNDDHTITAVIHTTTQTGYVLGPVDFDHVNLDVKLNGQFIRSEALPFSDSFNRGGTLAFRYNEFVPESAPAGTYTLTFNFQDEAASEVGCFQLTYEI